MSDSLILIWYFLWYSNPNINVFRLTQFLECIVGEESKHIVTEYSEFESCNVDEIDKINPGMKALREVTSHVRFDVTRFSDTTKGIGKI